MPMVTCTHKEGGLAWPGLWLAGCRWHMPLDSSGQREVTAVLLGTLAVPAGEGGRAAPAQSRP